MLVSTLLAVYVINTHSILALCSDKPFLNGTRYICYKAPLYLPSRSAFQDVLGGHRAYSTRRTNKNIVFSRFMIQRLHSWLSPQIIVYLLAMSAIRRDTAGPVVSPAINNKHVPPPRGLDSPSWTLPCRLSTDQRLLRFFPPSSLHAALTMVHRSERCVEMLLSLQSLQRKWRSANVARHRFLL